jgi:hypothetical protein
VVQPDPSLRSPEQAGKSRSVAVLSIAMERDLFAWFQSLGITVDRAKAQIEVKWELLNEGQLVKSTIYPELESSPS